MAARKRHREQPFKRTTRGSIEKQNRQEKQRRSLYNTRLRFGKFFYGTPARRFSGLWCFWLSSGDTERATVAPCYNKIMLSPAPTAALFPVVISTGPSGAVCNPVAFDAARGGALALDAAQAGVMAAESDPLCDDVGFGGRPDASGNLSLDAALMDGRNHRAGAVAGLLGVVNAVAVARRVMDATPHVFLVGQGARDFATAQGFADDGALLTDAAREQLAAFRRGDTRAVSTGHDTLGCCVLDTQGDLAVACSTSGLSFKLPGRVGDSPIIGSGLYVENAVGAATCMGQGEQMMQIGLSLRVVLGMERGLSPAEACADAVRFLLSKRPTRDDLECCCIALAKTGESGAASTNDTAVYYRSDALNGTVQIAAPRVARS